MNLPMLRIKAVTDSQMSILADEGDKVDDIIKRQDAIDAIETTTWYHQNKNLEMVEGANDEEHQAWYMSQDIGDIHDSIMEGE